MGNKVSQHRKLQGTPISTIQIDTPIQFEVEIDGIDTFDKISDNSTSSSSTFHSHAATSSCDLDSFANSNKSRYRMTSFTSPRQVSDNSNLRNKLKRFQSCIIQQQKDYNKKDKRSKETDTDPVLLAITENYNEPRAKTQTPYSNSLNIPMSNPITSPVAKNAFGAAKLNQLKNWTGLKNCNTIFSSYFNELSARELNANICGKRNIMLIITTESGDIFGCFDTTLIPFCISHQKVIQSEEFILFVFDSYGNTALLQKSNLKQSDDYDALTLFSSYEDVHVFEIENGFLLENDGFIKLHQNIFDNYEIITGNVQYPQQYFITDLKINHLIALEWF